MENLPQRRRGAKDRGVFDLFWGGVRFPFVNHGCITSNKELYGTFCPDVGVPGLLLNLNEVTVRILRDCARLGCRSILPFKIENLILDGECYYGANRVHLPRISCNGA